MKAGVPTLIWSIILLLTATFPARGVTSPALTATQDSLLAEINSLRVSYQALPALEMIENFLPACRAENDSIFLLRLLSHKGELQCSIGQVDASEPTLNDAIELAGALKDSRRMCENLRWLGIAIDTMGRNDEAQAIYQRLLGLASVNDLPLYQGWALVGMAWQDFKEGRNDDSLAKYRRALTHFERSGSVRGQTWALNGIGTAQSNLGEYEGARAAYEQTWNKAIESRDMMGESMALNNLGALNYSFGRPDRALTEFTKARDLLLKMDYPRGAFKPSLNIALCQTLLGRFQLAETSLEALLEECRQHNFADQEGMVLSSLGDLAFTRGMFNRAARFYEQTINTSADLVLKNKIEARIGLAKAQRVLGDNSAALQTLEGGRLELVSSSLFLQKLMLETEIGKSLLEAERYREALPVLQGVTRLASEQGLTGFRLQTLPMIASVWRTLGQPDSSLAALRRATATWEVERGLPMDPEWREQRGELGQQIYTDLADLLLTMESEPDRIRQAYDQLQVFKGRTLLERMLGPGKTGFSPDDEFKTIDLAGLQQTVLEDGELLLDYFVGPGGSFLFAITTAECRVIRLPTEPRLREKLRYLYDLIYHPPPSTELDMPIITDLNHNLAEILIGDVRDMLPLHRHIFYAPDGILNLLPPAMVFDQGVEASANWARLPSATLLARIRDRSTGNSRPGSGEILAMAGGDSSPAGSLPGAISETRMLSSRFKHVSRRLNPPRIFPGSGGITAADLAGFSVLHLGTHADLDDQSPWNSSLYLEERGEGSTISASEVAVTRLDAQLAVLAACESAGGRILAGEGVLGLTNAFISAGVPAVIATLWPVDDSCTATLMDHFYSALAAGDDVAGALKRARNELRSTPATSHPFFWAGYILVGDGGITVPLDEKTPLRRHAWRVALITASLALLLLAIRRRR